jgi:Ribbon-helix-helix domain
MSRRFHITLGESQYDYLSRASERTSISMAELIRRALDEKYPASHAIPSEDEFTIAVWRRPERRAGTNGRRAGTALDRGSW